MLQIKDWIICFHKDENGEPVYDAIDLKIIWWNDNWMIDLWTDMYWVVYHDLDEIKAYHWKVIAAHSNVFFGLNSAITSDNQEAAQSSMKTLRYKVGEQEWREMPTALEQMKEVPEELSISPESQDKTPIEDLDMLQKKMSPTSKKEVTKAPVVKIKDEKSSYISLGDEVVFYPNLTRVKTERGVDYDTLKRNIGKRVYETDKGFILDEDLKMLGLKVLAAQGINLVTDDNKDV